jgi:large subunit ribosomal protein L24
LRRSDAEHVLVDGVNRVKKHVKPNPVKGVVGGIIEKRCRFTFRMFRSTTRRPKSGSRRFQTLEDGTKVRFFKSNGEVLGA